jgi:uncharacterized membrane protein
MKYFTPKLRRELLIFVIPLVIIFSLLYSVLSIVRHNNYGSFGYDLGINYQTVWRYSTFQIPITTIDPFPELPKLAAHVELVYALISPFFWIWNDPRMLLILEVIFVCQAGIPIYLLARSKKLKISISLAIVFSYLIFYGVQNALWHDVHSISFGAGFLAWFIYFNDIKKHLPASIFFVLAIISKENVALITLAIAFTYFLLRRDKLNIIYIISSILYLLFVYLIFFPHIMNITYLYQNEAGLISNLSPLSLFDSVDKRNAILYSFLGFGLLPLASIFIIPVIVDLGTYFALASDLKATHGIYMHYRVALAPLLALATIYTIYSFKKLNKTYLAIYLIVSALIVQYLLHLPLSYLVKRWFWQQPDSVRTINRVISEIPDNTSIVSQNNITPHISGRDNIYTLYPEKRQFKNENLCKNKECPWFRWHNKPQYLIVDISDSWDARHFLTDRATFISGLNNLETAGVIKRERKEGTTILYRVIKNPHE